LMMETRFEQSKYKRKSCKVDAMTFLRCRSKIK
jgi:hypothetical protein